MDNNYILLLLIKLRVNLGLFIYCYLHKNMITYNQYLEVMNCEDLCTGVMSEFEFKYLCSYLRLIGEI